MLYHFVKYIQGVRHELFCPLKCPCDMCLRVAMLVSMRCSSMCLLKLSALGYLNLTLKFCAGPMKSGALAPLQSKKSKKLFGGGGGTVYNKNKSE